MVNNINKQTRVRPTQKLIAFSEHEKHLLEDEIKNGWKIISLAANGTRFVGILEQNQDNAESIYIPPRKKIKFL